ncbi:hypothetical protein WJX84_002344 [Apatococcus fuscideae]|uniref:Uncharacterized protein n=1 Tax=Apatococcus fuscideae TaxID=2026836 RepID=A0AAW1TBE0_9CHLO
METCCPCAQGSQTEVVLQKQSGLLFTWGLLHSEPAPVQLTEQTGCNRVRSMAVMSDELILVTHQGLCCCVLSSARPTPVPGGRDSPPRMLPLASSRPIIGLLATLQISKVAAGKMSTISGLRQQHKR